MDQSGCRRARNYRVQPARHPHARGSIFLGHYSPQAAGDHGSGPNHVLPTGRVARFRGGLQPEKSISLKVITVQESSRKGSRKPAPSIIAVSNAEVQFHVRSSS